MPKDIDETIVRGTLAAARYTLAMFAGFGAATFAFFHLMNETKDYPKLQQAVFTFSIFFVWLFLVLVLVFLAIATVKFIGILSREFNWARFTIPVTLPTKVLTVVAIAYFGWSNLGDLSSPIDFADAFSALNPFNTAQN